MTKQMLLIAAALAGTTLIGAAPGGYGQSGTVSTGGYPPCSRTVADSCIQLYERGVRTRENLAMNGRLGPGREPISGRAMGGPMVDVPMAPVPGSAPASRDDYPPCSRTITDRCIQLYERGVG